MGRESRGSLVVLRSPRLRPIKSGCDDPSDHGQNRADVIEIMASLVDNRRVVDELKELPDLTCGHASIDRRRHESGILVEETGRNHLGDALAETGLDIVLLRLDDRRDRCPERWHRRTDRKDKVTLADQAARRIDIEPLPRKDSERSRTEVSAGHQDRRDDELAPGLLADECQLGAITQRLP